MRTQLMIILIIAAVVGAAVGVLAGLVLWLGWLGGVAVAAALLIVLCGMYLVVVRPWHLRWGASDAEVAIAMPGDELIVGARTATRAITIAASPEEVWPWLIQLGYGKAGWYSYDWIDNDFRPSADRILSEHQDLQVGDKILMMPDMGFVVTSLDPPRSIVSVLEDGSTSWRLGMYPADDGATRLVSRWRPKFDITPATVLFTALSDPGTSIMEQKMLRTIRRRVEASRRGPAR